MDPMKMLRCSLFMIFTCYVGFVTSASSMATISPKARITQHCSYTYEDWCYVFSEIRTTGGDAAEFCNRASGHLAIIRNAEMSKEIAKHMKYYIGVEASDSDENQFWIGVNDTATEGKFMYSDGTPLLPSNYSFWGPGQPDNYRYYMDQDCVAMSAFTEQWFDQYCTQNSRYYVCEYQGECNIDDIDIPHSTFDFCYSNKMINSGTKIRIHCSEGFHLLGEEYVKCETNSTWSPSPSCVRGCPDAISVPHASLVTKKKQYYVGDTATYVCDDDYYSSKDNLKTDFTMHCKSNSQWSHNDFSCIRREKFITKKVELNPLISTELSCNVDNNKTESIKSWLWLRNSENVNVNKDSLDEDSVLDEGQDKRNTFSIDADGTLKINEASEMTAGFYICFAVGITMELGSVFYNVHLPEQCLNLNGVNRVKERLVKENDTLLLECPHDPRQSSSSWFKNGFELFSNNEFTLIPDGSLLISEARVSHEGEYECKIVSKFSNCSESITAKVFIEGSGSNDCGKQKDKDHQPWLVSLWWKDETLPFCYGVLINQQWVLTAANCLSGIFRKKVLNVFARFHLKSNEHSPIREIPITTVKIHPMFSKKLYVNDIGLMKLKEKINVTSSTQPICLSDFDFTVKKPCDRYFSLEGTVSGWGPLEKDIIDETSVLLESMKVLSPSECQSDNYEYSYSDKILCSIKTNDTVPTYAGDSGSPLVIESQGQMYLLGIFSWGERMSQLGQHDYFTKVSIYVPWIEKYIHTY